MHISKGKILLLLFILNYFSGKAQSASAYNTTRLKQKLQQFLSDPAIAHAGVGFVVEDVNTGTLLLENNTAQSLVPASTMKIFTTGAALGMLGPDFRFKTSLAYQGKLDAQGTLHGDILIMGGGDPTLGSGRLPGTPGLDAQMQQWADVLKKAGIKKIEGRIIGVDNRYETASIPPSWLWMDMGNYYGAGAYGLNINENMFSLQLKPGVIRGNSVEVLGMEPSVPGVQFINELTTAAAGSGDQSYIYGAPYTYLRYIRGTIPAGGSIFKVKGSIPDPALFAAQQLKKVLGSNGITISDSAMNARSLGENSIQPDSVFYTQLSPPLSDIVHYTNLKSINLYAETLLKEMAYQRIGKGIAEVGIQQVTDYWKSKAVDMGGFFMTDGSGLSPTDGVSARQMVQALAAMKKEPWFDDFYNSLPVAGESGSMSSMGKGTPISGKLRAKSGHMERVRSYAGYMQAKNGHWLAFALIVNNYSADNAAIRQKIDELLQALAL